MQSVRRANSGILQKRPGKREASLRAQAAKKKAGGGKPTAKKGPNRERRNIPRPEALGLTARSLAVQHPAPPAELQPGDVASATDKPARQGGGQGGSGHALSLIVRRRSRGASSRWPWPVRTSAYGPDDCRPGPQAGGNRGHRARRPHTPPHPSPPQRARPGARRRPGPSPAGPLHGPLHRPLHGHFARRARQCRSAQAVKVGRRVRQPS